MKAAIEHFRKLYSDLEEQIEARIEAHRKGDFNIKVTDKDGNPVEATVCAIQKTHKFDFGVAPLMLGDMKQHEAEYQKAVTDLFNLITTTFCWGVMETSEGVYRFEEGSEYIYRRPPADRMLKFAKKNGLRIKGQPLLADSWHPEWASRDEEKLKEQITNYIQKVADRYDGKFYLFDVVNESFLCHKRTPDFPLYKGDSFEYVKWVLDTASKIFSKKCILERNESTGVNYDVTERYYNENKQLLEMGIRLDSIGFQFHFMSGEGFRDDLCIGRYNLNHLMETYMKMSSLGVPMYVSEVTMPTVYEGLTEAEGEELQAEVLYKLYKLWFSIPSMQGIIFWNLKDGDTWKGESACKGCLLDEFMRRKKSYYALEYLIKKEWNTSFNDTVNADGKLTFRGFYGKYDVTVKYNDTVINKSCNFDNNSKTFKITI